MDQDGVLDTVENIRKLVEFRGECSVLCFVKSKAGLEIVSSVEDYVVLRGMLKVAEEAIIDREYKASEVNRAAEVAEERRALEVIGGLKNVKGGVQ